MLGSACRNTASKLPLTRQEAERIKALFEELAVSEFELPAAVTDTLNLDTYNNAIAHLVGLELTSQQVIFLKDILLEKTAFMYGQKIEVTLLSDAAFAMAGIDFDPLAPKDSGSNGQALSHNLMI